MLHKQYLFDYYLFKINIIYYGIGDNNIDFYWSIH